MTLYGKIDKTAKTPELSRNPGQLPAVYRTNGTTILNFHKCPGYKLKRMGFMEADISKPEAPEYDEKTQDLCCEWVYQDKRFVLKYKAIPKQDSQTKTEIAKTEVAINE
jgi:hypothetical protein